jgi:hypothetical protein
MIFRIWFLFVLIGCRAVAAGPQVESQFDLHLIMNDVSAGRTIELYEGRFGRSADIARLPGSQLALAITSVLAQRSITLSTLERSLEAAKFNQNDGDEAFRMLEARGRVGEIKELLGVLQRRNFMQRVTSTVQQIFPTQTRVRAHIPVFLVAFGHQNIDAFVTRAVWREGMLVDVGNSTGEVTVVVNLAKAVDYGRNADERFLGLMGVVAHEVFHAAFELYKENSPAWRQYALRHRSYFDQLLELAHNEGIAYYLSLVQQTGGELPSDGMDRVQTAFRAFSDHAQDLLAPDIAHDRAAEIIQKANLSGYWENYGAITGMVVARQIDRTYGRTALVETIERGPNHFFRLYLDITRRDPGLPAFSPAVRQALLQRE